MAPEHASGGGDVGIFPPDFVAGLADLPMGEVRARRDRLAAAEAEVSFVRRLVQGRLDILLAERDRRQKGAPPRPLEELVTELPSILAEGGTGSGVGLPVFIDPATAEVDTHDVDAAADASLLSDLPAASDDRLAAAVAALQALERDVSDRRHAIHERLAAVNAEIGRRYQTGEASPDSLLT